jgi:hypothetical protein
MVLVTVKSPIKKCTGINGVVSVGSEEQEVSSLEIRTTSIDKENNY